MNASIGGLAPKVPFGKKELREGICGRCKKPVAKHANRQRLRLGMVVCVYPWFAVPSNVEGK